MNFHNTRGMYDDIAKWVEEHDVEVDWEAIMQCKWWVGPKDWVPPPKWSVPKPFPSRLTPPIATKLLFAQWWHGLHIQPEVGDPLDEYVAPRISDHQNVVPKCEQQRGGEGVDPGPVGDAATGPNSWKIFLKQIAAIEKVEIIELKLISEEERRGLVRMAWIEEELRRRESEHNRERVMRQSKGAAKFTLSRRSEEWLRQRACRGNLVAIEEMERKGYGSEEEHRKWRELNVRLVELAGEARAKMKEKRKESEMEGEEVEGEEVAEGPEVVPEHILMGAAQEIEVSGAATGWDEAIEDNEADLEVKAKGIERELEVIRVGPNPRILTCRYRELASERICKVGVKNVANFVRGMRFKMTEPVAEIEYAGVWRYEGKLPRLRGRW